MSSFFRRNHPHPDDLDNTDDDNDDTIDPDLRLRTVRTAASAIAESIQSERRAQRRKTSRKKGSRFFRKGSDKRRTQTTESKDTTVSETSAKITGKRRNIYVNTPLPTMEMDRGEPIVRYPRNKVRTSSEWSLYSWN